MTKIIVKDGNVDLAMRKSKVAFAKSGVPSKLKEKQFAEKRGVKNRRKKEEMTRNARKHARRYN